ncbi:MAG: hypothetical protein WHT45_02490 [Ignavibacterium sp.]
MELVVTAMFLIEGSNETALTLTTCGPFNTIVEGPAGILNLGIASS